jgi:hypothetical protein
MPSRPFLSLAERSALHTHGTATVELVDVVNLVMQPV